MGHNIPVYTRAQVEQEAGRVFGPESVKGIMALLDQYRSEGEGIERVQMAILKLSGKDLVKLHHYIKQAQKDFRDVLYWAEYYGDSGKGWNAGGRAVKIACPRTAGRPR